MFRLPCLAAVLLALSGGVFGQAAPPGRTPIPEVAVATPPPVAPNVPAGAPDTVPNMQFPNSDVQDVLHFYETLTGKKLVMDNFVQGKVNIFISKPVSREEAIRIIEMNLSLNGFSLVPAEGDIIEVVGTGKSPRSASVPVISDESEIPPGDQVISYLFKLRYADAIELQQALTQYLERGRDKPRTDPGAPEVWQPARDAKLRNHSALGQNCGSGRYPASGSGKRVHQAGTRRREQGGRSIKRYLRERR